MPDASVGASKDTSVGCPAGPLNVKLTVVPLMGPAGDSRNNVAVTSRTPPTDAVDGTTVVSDVAAATTVNSGRAEVAGPLIPSPWNRAAGKYVAGGRPGNV